MKVTIELVHSLLPGCDTLVVIENARDTQDAINQMKKSDLWLDNSFKIGAVAEIN